MHTEANQGPLQGIVIADFSRVLAGPYATMLLADMGATVIKVESPQGDETRSWTPPQWNNESTYFLSTNRNKRSIVLDFNDEGDRATAKAIATSADVLVENFMPGRLDTFGLGFDDIKAENPGIVYASITGFGPGQGAALPGYDLLVQGVSGLMSLTGSADGPPLRAGVAVVDVITGLHTALGILAALNIRSQTGAGQLVETNLMSSALSALVNQASAALLGDVVPHRMGNEHPSIFPYGPFATADGLIIIACGNNRQFHALCAALDIPEVSDAAAYATVALRNQNRDELAPHLEAALATRPASEWHSHLSGFGVPCAPINDISRGIAHGEALGLAPVISLGDGERIVSSIANPITFSATPVSYRHAPPTLGQDTDWVQHWLHTGRFEGSHHA